MKRFFSLAIICGSVLLCLRAQAQQGGTGLDSNRRTPAELHQLKQEIRNQRRAQRVDKQASKQAYVDNRRIAQQQRRQTYQDRKQQRQQTSADEAALLQRKYDKKFQRQEQRLAKEKKRSVKELKDHQQVAKKREKNLAQQNHRLRKKQKKNTVQANRTLAENKKQLQQIEREQNKLAREQNKTQQLKKKSYKVVRLASKAIPATAILKEKPATALSSTKAIYMRKLLQVSPRISYGVGSFKSTMTYDLPNLSNALGNTVNNLQEKYPWVPWKQVTVIPTEGTRTRTVRQQGKFFGTVGMNLPVVFVEIEAGGGRFTQPALTLKDLWPPNELFQLERLTSLMVDRVTQSKPQRAANLRIGIDAERLIPAAYLPRKEFKRTAIGLDASAYYLLGVDLSYKSGIELLGEHAAEKMVESFGSIPLVSETVKMQAAQSMIRQIEQSLPAYLWPPAMQGFGLVGKAYWDLGTHTRIVLQYHFEHTKGLSFTDGDFLQQGPALRRTFLTFGITTQL
ncbi:MAG: hypothetical protein AAF587_02800 [Bacteroidota bacterium]